MSRSNWTVPPQTESSSGRTFVQPSSSPEDSMKERLRTHWDIMHKTAAWATATGQSQVFPSWARYMIDNLPCGNCIPHGQAYYRMNPPEKESCSLWMWKFHNSVNRRLGKPELNWESYDQIYLKKSQESGKTPAPCTACGGK